MTPPLHQPVLLNEVLDALDGAHRVADVTLGDGGHAAALREHGATILGIDRDPDAIRRARDRLGQRGIVYLEAAFGSAEALDAVRAFRPDGILADLGVSARLLDDDARGFSFRPGVPLDMRMDRTGPTAAELLNRAPPDRLARAFRHLADEPRAWPLAREIVRRRASTPLWSSDDLVNAIRAVLGARSGPADFARIFQAVRIELNQELTQLEAALPAWRDALQPGGRLVVISYHSGEDRLVKHHFREWSRDCVCPPQQPMCTCRGTALGVAAPRKPVRPNADEIARNPRARSAKLRVFRVSDAG